MEYGKFLAQKTKEELIDMILNTKQGTRVAAGTFQRKIALRMCYDGRGYCGLVHQPNAKTIEDFLKRALVNSGIAKPGVQVTFAGRTDKKVSASGMVLSVVVNSLVDTEKRDADTLNGGLDGGTGAAHTLKHIEFNYDTILNTHLPPDIRITGWCPVPQSFCARHNCVLRCYRYFFLPEGLDIQLMKRACLILREGKDFRNLAKPLTRREAEKIADLDRHFYRPIKNIEIEDAGNYCVLNISSRSFLHNMVRKIFWVLKEVGSGRKDMLFVRKALGQERVVCGTSRPEFLVFEGAEYEPKLLFRRNSKVHNFKNTFVENIAVCSVFDEACAEPPRLN